MNERTNTIEVLHFLTSEELKYGVESNHIEEGVNPYHTYYN